MLICTGQWSFNTDRLYVGHILFDYIIDITLRISLSQNRAIQHALRDPELNDVLSQVCRFRKMGSRLDEHI